MLTTRHPFFCALNLPLRLRLAKTSVEHNNHFCRLWPETLSITLAPGRRPRAALSSLLPCPMLAIAGLNTTLLADGPKGCFAHPPSEAVANKSRRPRQTGISVRSAGIRLDRTHVRPCTNRSEPEAAIRSAASGIALPPRPRVDLLAVGEPSSPPLDLVVGTPGSPGRARL